MLDRIIDFALKNRLLVVFVFVLCTGFGRQLEGEEDALIGIRRVISKPVSVLTLARAVREALDGE